jgi:hypothetical protein
MRVLLESGADANASIHDVFVNAFATAVYSGNKSTTQLLLRLGWTRIS